MYTKRQIKRALWRHKRLSMIKIEKVRDIPRKDFVDTTLGRRGKFLVGGEKICLASKGKAQQS